MYRVEERNDWTGKQYVTTGGGEMDRVSTAAEIEMWNRLEYAETELRNFTFAIAETLGMRKRVS